jgi:DHA1 family multidrug resistance protein-like MFS transporter
VRLSWRGANILILVANATSFAAEGHLVAFAPLQLRQLGLAEQEVVVWSGLLFAVTMATALPLGPFWGVLAERFSRRTIILRSYLTLAVALLVTAWGLDQAAPAGQDPSAGPGLAILVGARALVGLSFGVGGVIIALQAMLTPPQQVGRAIAVIQAAQPIAASIGPPLGAYAIPHIGLQGLFVVDAGLMLAAALALALLLPEPSGGHKPSSVLGRVGEVLRLAWQLPAVRWSFVNQSIARGAIAVVDTYLPVRIAQVAADPAVAIGWTLGAYGLLNTVAAGLLTRFADRVDVLRLYWASMLFGAVLAAGLAVAPWLWLIALLAALRAIPSAFSRPLLFMHLVRVVPPQHQTALFGLLPTAGNTGSLTIPLVASTIAGLGLGAVLAFGALAHAASALAGVRLHRLR